MKYFLSAFCGVSIMMTACGGSNNSEVMNGTPIVDANAAVEEVSQKIGENQTSVEFKPSKCSDGISIDTATKVMELANKQLEIITNNRSLCNADGWCKDFKAVVVKWDFGLELGGTYKLGDEKTYEFSLDNTSNLSTELNNSLTESYEAAQQQAADDMGDTSGDSGSNSSTSTLSNGSNSTNESTTNSRTTGKDTKNIELSAKLTIGFKKLDARRYISPDNTKQMAFMYNTLSNVCR